jgi:hypothetical protein
MKIAVFISDNRPLDFNKETCQYNSCAAYINAIYCMGYKYDFYYFKPLGSDVFVCRDQNTGEKRHASWSKLQSAYLLLTTANKNYDYVVCIDSDCVFKNIKKSLESIITTYPDHDIITANNLPYHPELPCCAFFICKNTEWTRQFLKHWYTYKNPPSESEEWSNVLKIANATYKIPNFELGEYWEQDTLWLLLQNPEIAAHIHVWDESIMFEQSADQYLIHISHERHTLRKPYLLSYVEHLENQTKQSFETILSILPVVEYDALNLKF